MTKQANSAAWRNLETVFLDRDGVINKKAPEGDYVRRIHDLQLLKGAAAAIARLNRAGVRVLVVSNQRGVALGLYTAEDVLAIETALENLLAAEGARLDGFYFCPHEKGTCNCRKPLPGMFEQARGDFPDIDSAGSVMIGDSLSDVEFGRGLGMRTVFLENDPERQRPGSAKARKIADFRVGSLAEAVDLLLGPPSLGEAASTAGLAENRAED